MYTKLVKLLNMLFLIFIFLIVLFVIIVSIINCCVPYELKCFVFLFERDESNL